MNKHYHSDQVIKELWMVKDSTASTYSNVGDYLSHLRQMPFSKINKAPNRMREKIEPSNARSTGSRRKAS